VFLVPSYGKTFAELGPEVKHRISHRAKALEQMLPEILKYLAAER
jgi:XTP/dITP diphosphohydrolase